MAIQPIDLQTLFTQVDKVGRTQVAAKDELVLQQAMQGVKIERKTEELFQAVNQAQNTGEGIENINDQNGRDRSAANGGKKGEAGEEEPPSEKENLVIRDPALGRNIDISL